MTDKAHHVDIDQFHSRLEAEQQMPPWCTMAPIRTWWRLRNPVGRPPGLARGASPEVEADKLLIWMKFMRSQMQDDEQYDQHPHDSVPLAPSEEPGIWQKTLHKWLCHSRHLAPS